MKSREGKTLDFLASTFSTSDYNFCLSPIELKTCEGSLEKIDSFLMMSGVSPIPELVQRAHVTTNRRVRYGNLTMSLSLMSPFHLEAMEVLRLLLR